MERIRELVCDFMEHHDVLTKLENEDWYCVEDALVEFLKHNTELREIIFRQVGREYHREDVMSEINYLHEDGTYGHETYTDEEIERITDEYETYLGDDDSWHEYLTDAIYDFERSKNEH